jgi:hypothetical protein
MRATRPDVDLEGLYSLKETAEALGVDRSTVTRAANNLDAARSLPYRIRRSTGKRIFRGQDIINYWLRVY